MPATAKKIKRNEKATELRGLEKIASPQTEEEHEGFSDPAFARSKLLPVHRWIPWIAGFASEFVSNALNRYLHHQGTVLDPFSGVGTTLFEARRHNHNAVGFEINPYAALACRTKANAYTIPVARLRAESAKFKTFCEEHTANGYEPRSQTPGNFKTRAEFYSPLVLRKVLIAQDFISAVEDRVVQDVFKLAFASTMVRYSNYSYEPSLGRRVSAGKKEIQDFPVAQEIERKLNEIVHDAAQLQETSPRVNSSVKVLNKSFFDYANHIEAGSVDLVVTSPPYLNNYHYNRNTRPQLYWLGFAEKPSDFKHLEESNFGKFWQTVREQERLNLEFELPGSDLTERLEELRETNPHKGIYGGNGWANYAAAYFNDCRRFAEGLNYVLRPGGTALVVIGNSILQGILIPTDVYFSKIAEAVGLEVVQIDVPRATRVGNSIIQSDVRVAKAKDKQKLYEAVVELRKS